MPTPAPGTLCAWCCGNVPEVRACPGSGTTWQVSQAVRASPGTPEGHPCPVALLRPCPLAGVGGTSYAGWWLWLNPQGGGRPQVGAGCPATLSPHKSSKPWGWRTPCNTWARQWYLRPLQSLLSGGGQRTQGPGPFVPHPGQVVLCQQLDCTGHLRSGLPGTWWLCLPSPVLPVLPPQIWLGAPGLPHQPGTPVLPLRPTEPAPAAIPCPIPALPSPQPHSPTVRSAPSVEFSPEVCAAAGGWTWHLGPSPTPACLPVPWAAPWA